MPCHPCPRRATPVTVSDAGTAPPVAPLPPDPPGVAVTDRRPPFFVYGTLLPGERNHALLAGRTCSWTPAVLPGALLFAGPGYPYAVADPAATGRVRGELAELEPAAYDAVTADLDALEGYVPGDPANRYDRVPVTVESPRGPATAWVYLAAPALARDLLRTGTPIPGGDWRARGPRGG
jgi:gamma-glutamylcyclotransferase (GGCT)/AIG2-like uncharacterized protein YtfP